MTPIPARVLDMRYSKHHLNETCTIKEQNVQNGTRTGHIIALLQLLIYDNK